MGHPTPKSSVSAKTLNETILSYMDKGTNPGDDFFNYCTKHWIEQNPNPGYYSIWSIFDMIDESTISKVHDIITHPGNSVISKKIMDFHSLYLNYKKRNSAHIQPILNYFDKFSKTTSRKKLIQQMAKVHNGIFFSVYVMADIKNSSKNEVYIEQAGLSLGNKDYYLKKDKHTKTVQNAYKEYFCRMLSELDMFDADEIMSIYKTLWHIEKNLAKSHKSVEELMDPSQNYNKMSVKELSKMTSFDWDSFLSDYGYDKTTTVIVGQPKAIKAGCKLLSTLPLDTLKTFILWDEFASSISYLSDKIYDIAFDFKKVLSGADEQRPKELRADDSCMAAFSDALSELYVKKYFNEDSKKAIYEQVNYIVDAYEFLIKQQQWLSSVTIDKAVDKLHGIELKLGYPDKFDDFSDIPVDPSKTIYEVVNDINEYFFQYRKNKQYNKDVDRTEWGMPAYRINAYYNPTNNEICFPAGILQFPFFDREMDFAFNFGGIGSTIGHEMTHGFDNFGRMFNKEGNMEDWWNKNEIDLFNDLNTNLIEYFDNIKINDELNANGKLTLSENIADLGGMKIAYYACEKYAKDHNLENSVINGFNWQQRFFISYGISWAYQITKEAAIQQTLNNEHSLNINRVNGILPHFQPWYDAFNLDETCKLYIPVEKRARIW